MTAEEMFKKIGFNKEVIRGDIKFFMVNKYCEEKIIYFDMKTKEVCVFCDCEEHSYSTDFYLNRDILKAIEKQLDELGW